jgi:hypothetical protein
MAGAAKGFVGVLPKQTESFHAGGGGIEAHTSPMETDVVLTHAFASTTVAV